jgi:Mor family transcriptional regulator
MGNNWIHDIAVEDLPENYQEMAAIIGIEAMLKLAEHYNKQGFYFRSLDDLIAKKKVEYIHKNFDGANHQGLARATGYSERWAYEILRRTGSDKQTALFEENQ